MLPFLLLALLQAVSAPASAPAAATPYHDADLKLTYTVPAGYKVENALVQDAVKAEKEKQTGAMRAAADCVTVPVSAMDMRTDFRLVAMLRLDAKCLGEKSDPAALTILSASVLKESLSRMGTASLQTPAATTIGSHAAGFVQGTSNSEKLGATFQGAAVCTIAEGDIVCWEFVASSTEALAAVSSSAVQFDGEAKAFPLLTLPAPAVEVPKDAPKK